MLQRRACRRAGCDSADKESRWALGYEFYDTANTAVDGFGKLNFRGSMNPPVGLFCPERFLGNPGLARTA